MEAFFSILQLSVLLGFFVFTIALFIASIIESYFSEKHFKRYLNKQCVKCGYPLIEGFCPECGPKK